MSLASYLNDVFNDEHSKMSLRNLQKAAFDVRYDTNIEVKSHGFPARFSRVDKMRFTALDFEKQCRMVPAHTDYSGINKHYISKEGYYSLESSLSALISSNLIPRNQVANFRDAYIGDDMTDSHVSFLYNMLVSWFKAVLRENNIAAGVKEETNSVTGLRRNYQDRHIRVTKLEGEEQEVDVKIDIGPPTLTEGPLPKYELVRQRDSAWEGPDHVVALPDVGDGEMKYYVSHLQGRKSGSEFNFEFPIAGIWAQSIMYYYVGTHEYNMSDMEDDLSIYRSPKKQWDLILKYTKMNRVERHLSAALQVLMDVTFRCCPDTAEGFALRMVPTRIYLPAPSYSRAKLPTCLTGDPYVPPDSVNVLNLSSYAHPSRLVMTGGMMNYLADAGAYLGAQHMSLSYDGFVHAYNYLESTVRGLISPSLQLATLRSLATGREAPTMNMCEMGVLYSYEKYFEFEGEVFFTRLDTTDDLAGTGGYVIEGGKLATGTRFMPPVPLYGMYNIVSKELTLGQHLTGSCKHTFDRNKSMTLEEAVDLANIYRMSEYNIVLERSRQSELIRPWASLYSPAVPPVTLQYSVDHENVYWLIEASKRRQARLMLPEVTGHHHGYQISMEVHVVNREFVAPNSTRSGVYDSRRATRDPKPLSFRVRIGQPVGVARMTAAPTESLKQEVDFGSLEPTRMLVAPQPAEAIPAGGDGISATTVEGTDTLGDEE